MEERDKLKLDQKLKGAKDKMNATGNTTPNSKNPISLAFKPEALTLTNKDVQHINKMQDRNDRFTNKLLVEKQLKEKHKSTIEQL